ncbi:MAG: hypothetical protein JWO92_21 [Chitinophagaceae bacterium]|nr:hypothetical protein [Chitinophagaceae bacterium]
MKFKKIFVAVIGLLVSINLQAQTYDTDAQAFFAATGITNTTQRNAVNQLVLSLKGAGLWIKMKAIYPFVGGSAYTHKFNLKDPRDLDSAFRLTYEFEVPPTHSSNGILWDNGLDNYAYANTHLNSYTTLSVNNCHLSVYIRTNSAEFGSDVANYDGTRAMGIISRYVDDNAYLDILSTHRAIAASTDSRGLNLVSRTSSSLVTAYKNGQSIATNTSTNSDPLPNLDLFLGCTNNQGSPSSFSHRELAFATIGDGLSSSEVSSFSQIIQTYQCSLLRAIEECTTTGGGGTDTTWVRSGNNIYFNNGNVGIGTSTPQSKLAVNGIITATKLTVTQTGWPDYVFDKHYKLPQLEKLEKFITINKHLPGIPSAIEIGKNGLDLGNSHALLLKKIEELTLLIIQQNKRIKILENQSKK